jgi:poly(3-hydroxybutyrate) depolymerase
MAATLAVAYPELVAGLALHSTVPYRAAATIERALAVMRGDFGDSVATAELASFVEVDMGERRRDIPVIVLHGSVDPVVNIRDGEVAFSQWRRANRSAQTEYLRIEGLAHAWSGGAAGEKYSNPNTADASALFVEFFTKYASLGVTRRGK